MGVVFMYLQNCHPFIFECRAGFALRFDLTFSCIIMFPFLVLQSYGSTELSILRTNLFWLQFFFSSRFCIFIKRQHLAKKPTFRRFLSAVFSLIFLKKFLIKILSQNCRKAIIIGNVFAFIENMNLFVDKVNNLKVFSCSNEFPSYH